MKDAVIHHAERLLGRGFLVGYHSCDQVELQDLQLHLDAGQILGVYINSAENKIFVAQHGLIMVNQIDSQLIKYSDIAQVKVLGDKETANQISLELEDGTKSTLFNKQRTRSF